MTLDLTKPVQTRDGRKARIICSDFSGFDGRYPIIAIIKNKLGEDVSVFTKNGKLYDDEILDNVESNEDLINVPVLNSSDIYIGGIYRSKDEWIYICVCVSNKEYPVFLIFEDDSSEYPYLTTFSISMFNSQIIECLGSLQNIHEYIKEKLNNRI